MPSPAVSIITRTKDRPQLLKRAIESVLQQTWSDWQLVVVNDGGSPDAVDAICAPLASRLQDRLLVIHHPASVGMEEAGNRGILASSGGFIALLDDDDSWEHKFLESCVTYLKTQSQALPELGGVVTHWNEIWERIESDHVKTIKTNIKNTLQFVSLYEMSFRCSIIPACFVYKRAAWEKAGRFNADLPLAGDWDFNLRFLSQFEIGVIPQPLANYHRRVSAAQNNAVHTSPDLLLDCAHQVRNNFMRQDLREGRCGLGSLMGLTHQLSQTSLWQILKRDLSALKRQWLYGQYIDEANR